MKISVKYFASIREAIGTNAEAVELPGSIHTVKSLRDILIAKGASYAEALARGKAIRTALNQTLCDEAALLTDACEVAFFPPVTGG